LSEADSPSFADCCGKCKTKTGCGAFVWGPKDGAKEAGPTNPNTCFMLQPTNVTKRAGGRTFGCMRSE
jgi:hypothetical protein